MTQSRLALAAFFGIWILLTGYATFIAPPLHYPLGATVTIPAVSSVRGAGNILEDAGVVHSSLVFALSVKIFNSGGVQAGTYAFPDKESVLSIAYRLSHGVTGVTAVKVTIPEGLNSREISELLKTSLGAFDSETFLVLAKANEGYLFPDTYYIVPGTTPEAVVQMMRATLDTKIEPFKEEIESLGKSLPEILTMASLLEDEGRKLETRKIISGILWKRITLGMPLQVDAVFGYILGKSGYAPTLDDLKIHSPYNTYTNRGLPPTPINNSGIEAIDAALHPTKTPYLYYLTGSDGNMYYARTFAEHIANKVHLK